MLAERAGPLWPVRGVNLMAWISICQLNQYHKFFSPVYSEARRGLCGLVLHSDINNGVSRNHSDIEEGHEVIYEFSIFQMYLVECAARLSELADVMVVLVGEDNEGHLYLFLKG